MGKGHDNIVAKGHTQQVSVSGGTEVQRQREGQRRFRGCSGERLRSCARQKQKRTGQLGKKMMVKSDTKCSTVGIGTSTTGGPVQQQKGSQLAVFFHLGA